jgi:hypothetical protein
MMILRPQGLFGVHEIWEMGPFRKLRRGSKPSSTSDAPTGGGAS